LISYKFFRKEVKNLVSRRLLASQRLKIRDSTQIYDSNRISGATDMGMPARAHGIGTPRVIFGLRPIGIKAQERSQCMLYSNNETICKTAIYGEFV
jgi:hypothetical protein